VTSSVTRIDQTPSLFTRFASLETYVLGITSTLVRRPLNTAVVRGSAAVFSCSSDVSNSVILWYNSTCVTSQYLGQCTKDIIYNGYGFARNVPPKFGVTSATNATHVTRDLNISPVQLADAGVYLCAEQQPGVSGATDSSSAQLIVLGNCSHVDMCKVRKVGQVVCVVDNDDQ